MLIYLQADVVCPTRQNKLPVCFKGIDIKHLLSFQFERLHLMRTRAFKLILTSILVGILWRIVGDALHIPIDEQLIATLATIALIELPKD